MSEHEHALPRAIEHHVLQARAAHVYLDAMASLKDTARRQLNIENARDILANLDAALLAVSADELLRARLQPLRDRLAERLREFE